MRKTIFSIFSLMTFTAFIATMTFAEEQPASKTTKPNVIFITIDDMNHWISSMREYQAIYNYPDYKTPNIDKLMSQGMFFTNAHVPAASCKPSRVSTFTGRYVSNHGVYRNPHSWLISPLFKNRDDVSIMQRFRKEGYRVIGGGKNFHSTHPGSWDEHLKTAKRSSEINESIGKLRKEYFEATKKMMLEREVAKGTPEQQKEWGKTSSNAITYGALDASDECMPDTIMIDYMISQLERKHDKPFYLGVGLTKPHMPWSVPRKYFDMYPLDKIPTPIVNADDLKDLGNQGQRTAGGGTHEYMVKSGKWKKAIQAYLATCTYADVQVGRLMKALDKSAYKDNTIVVLWSDHGWHLGDKNHWKKFTVWEETTHVPMAIIAPGITKGNQKSPRTVGSIDLYPTLLELCGMKPDTRLDGRSLVTLLKNPMAEWNHPVLTSHSRGVDAIRTERYRLVQYPKDGEMELYDHQNDPLEHTNLINNPEYADVIKKLKPLLPAKHVPGVAQIGNIVRDAQVKLLGSRITGPTYSKASKEAYQAALDAEAGQEGAAAKKKALEVFTTAKDNGVYDKENIVSLSGAFQKGKTVLVEKSK